MKVLFYYPHPLPVKTYGGTERILYWLMKELARFGHQPYLIGSPLSQVSDIGAILLPWDGKGNWWDLIPSEIDLAHLFHVPGDELKGLPVLTTIHGNGQPGEQFGHNTVFLSRKHAENHGAEAFVYNGIDLDEYPFQESDRNGKWDRFLFLANARWKVKNLRDSARAARANRKHLYVAGGRWKGLSRYIHSCGKVDQKRKLELLRCVDGFVNPVRWHEPFGVNMIEAFSQGLPVIGSCYGSLSELIREDVGICCEGYQHFAQALAKRPSFDSKGIRHYVEENFSSSVMAKNYLEYYQKVLKGEKLNREIPQTVSPVPPQQLLPF